MNSSTFMITEKTAQIMNRWASTMDNFFSTYSVNSNFTINGSIICENIIAAQLQTINNKTGEVTTNVTANDDESSASIDLILAATDQNFQNKIVKRDSLGSFRVSNVYSTNSNIEKNFSTNQEQQVAVDLNTVKVGITTAQASNISANNVKVGITDTQSENISANASKNSANASNISANTSNISANTSKNSQNTSNISANASNISANTSNISTKLDINGISEKTKKIDIKEGVRQMNASTLQIKFTGESSYTDTENGICYFDTDDDTLCITYNNQIYKLSSI
tara:strand:+ start:1157 stop:2002 length:846 start_codon:yes stop_codon:yes gene_type:complete